MMKTLLFLILLNSVTFVSFAQQKECKLIIFQNIGECKSDIGDCIFSELPLLNIHENQVNDSTYSTAIIYEGEDSLSGVGTIYYNYKDSLKLISLEHLITSSAKKNSFIKSGHPKSESLSKGSLMIRLYDKKRNLMGIYHCSGITNTQTWIDYLIEEANKISNGSEWGFHDVLSYYISTLKDGC